MARTPPSAIIVSQKQVRFLFSGGESSFGTCNIRFGSSLSALVSTVVIISLWIETTSLAGIPSMSLAFLDDALDMDPLLMKNKLSSCINFWVELKMEGLEGEVDDPIWGKWTVQGPKIGRSGWLKYGEIEQSQNAWVVKCDESQNDRPLSLLRPSTFLQPKFLYLKYFTFLISV